MLAPSDYGIIVGLIGIAMAALRIIERLIGRNGRSEKQRLELQIISALEKLKKFEDPLSAGAQDPNYWKLYYKSEFPVMMETAVNNAFLHHNEELRHMIQEIIGDWLDKRLGGPEKKI